MTTSRWACPAEVAGTDMAAVVRVETSPRKTKCFDKLTVRVGVKERRRTGARYLTALSLLKNTYVDVSPRIALHVGDQRIHPRQQSPHIVVDAWIIQQLRRAPAAAVHLGENQIKL